MRVVAINGSPRKDWNTATLLQHALDGAASAGAETRMVHLYDLAFAGCHSCFACKRKGNTCGGLCAIKDDLRPVLEDIIASDAVVVGSPIYFSDVSGETRSFLERLLFPNISYDDHEAPAPLPHPLRAAWVFTMNCPEEFGDRIGYVAMFRGLANLLRIIGPGPRVMGNVEAPGGPEILAAWDTYQFSDYSKYETAWLPEEQKRKHREELFPQECREAFEMGARLTTPV